ncbi:hypothetical protein [Adhaeribacter radiodurans]|uniref:Uncharacterized protein n=1 Tax=Adhaeribacter radiodurans TaxID=2745197 RepID=A0A7L7L6E1_9BACT|nr:hypothetical protein [Adhaeribacter radiodurans]QMU28370.1 hypothetical protein HUW48_10135 [Adhaeribacter radiodurans]
MLSEEKFLYKILRNYKDTVKNRRLDQDFQIVALSMQLLTLSLQVKPSEGNKNLNKTLRDYNKLNSNLEANNIDFDILVKEKVYINTYFHFEEFIFKTFEALYKYLPKFLMLDEITIDYEDLFE